MKFDMVDAAKNLTAGRPTHQSLGRGLQILEAVATLRGGATLADVARRMKLARSTTHYLMQALVNLGYLSQQSDGRNYQLGLKVFRLAGRSLTSEQIAATAMPILNELCQLTHESVAIGICRGDTVTLVATRDTDGPVRVVQSAGAQRPVHCTALGKVLLAWMPAAERSRFVSGLRFEKLTPKSIVQRASFERELRRVRSAGYAIDDEEFILGVRCLAAPVFDESGEVAMALSTVGPKHRMTHQRLRECRPLVLDCARKLSNQFGCAALPM
jgi:DNA-binding IclR family transcriptional regulator